MHLIAKKIWILQDLSSLMAINVCKTRLKLTGMKTRQWLSLLARPRCAIPLPIFNTSQTVITDSNSSWSSIKQSRSNFTVEQSTGKLQLTFFSEAEANKWMYFILVYADKPQTRDSTEELKSPSCLIVRSFYYDFIFLCSCLCRTPAKKKKHFQEHKKDCGGVRGEN